ncbi:MAG: hypothetical protein E6J62_13580 [Deltaproteobacteria bacterium]|nr:MAG: hypothetical protein E6J85_03590 [Deltaproteobacteria bacterium]TMB31528.1 MAG: hypothetical protein E6J62_13580 [Deltaproteobacteria bacterium]TMB36247.1 MAG: hypothetical protein E6J61_00700 [Deltaproteobacteria bacterium]
MLALKLEPWLPLSRSADASSDSLPSENDEIPSRSQPFGRFSQELGSRLARGLLLRGRMQTNELIGVRHLSASGRRIPVLFFQNEGGSFAGHCLLADDDTAIIDGPSPEAVLALFERLIEDVLFLRSPIAASAGLCARAV